jgi:hypothetical protein
MPRLRCDGQDPNHTLFSVESFTTEGVVYTTSIDNRTGMLTCSCMDASCRQKHAFLMDKQMVNACKHQRLVLKTMRALGCFGHSEE